MKLIWTQRVRQGALNAAALSFCFLAGSSFGQVTNLNPGDSINFSNLVGNAGLSVFIGDKLFDDFSFQYSDTDLNIGNDLQPSVLVLTALSNQIGFGISFTGPMTAIGDIVKDIVVRFSVAVSNAPPGTLISDVHLTYNGTVQGAGFSQVVEQIFTGGFGANVVTNISVFNSTNAPAVFQSQADLITPGQKFYIEKDIVFGGGAPGGQNSAFISVIDQTFSQIPEPSTIILCLGGMGTLFLVRRRKK